jgi:hypothetical protein
MLYEAKQYGCNDCGQLTEFLDVDQPIPKGWLYISERTHYCPKCAPNHLNENLT